MNRLPVDQQVRVLTALCEGNSIRSTCRMTGAAKGTVTRLLETVGPACVRYHDAVVRNLRSRRIQCDEIWSYVGAKAKNARRADQGDIWTWTALDADSKLVISWLVGERTSEYAQMIMHDVRSRVIGRPQITTDGLPAYRDAVESAFAADVDYAQLVKLYEGASDGEVRYSPSVCTGTRRNVVNGLPDHRHISTSYVERQNLTIRMGMRRFTRLTNAFSKKFENLEHALALHFFYYNFCRKHQTLKTTPAIAAGVANHVFALHEIVRLAFKPGVLAA